MNRDFRPITLLFGPNRAGKTTILNAWHDAREVCERHNPREMTEPEEVKSETMIKQHSIGSSTTDVIQPEMARVLAAKTEAERLRIGWGMWRSARRMLVRIVAAEDPELSPEDLQKTVARRMSHGT